MTAARPSRTSSPSRFSSFSFRRPLLARVLVQRAASARALKPERCVPPSCVLMLFANEKTDSTYEVFHCIATSTAPAPARPRSRRCACAPGPSTRSRRRRSRGSRPRSGTRGAPRPRARRRARSVRPRVRNAVSRKRWIERLRRELELLEDLGVGQEVDRRARVALLGLADDLHVGGGLAAGELLAVDLAVAADLGDEPLRERVHDRDADAVQAARDLVAVAAELAAGVELRQDDRRARAGPARA